MRDFFTLSQSTRPSLWMSRMRCALICSANFLVLAFCNLVAAFDSWHKIEFQRLFLSQSLLVNVKIEADVATCYLLFSDAHDSSNGFLSSFVPFYFLSFLMLVYSFITDYQAFSLRYKDNTTRDKNETKVGKQSANLGKNNEPIQNRLSFLIDCKSVTLHHLTILLFPMVRPAWDNWWVVQDVYGTRGPLLHRRGSEYGLQDDGEA